MGLTGKTRAETTLAFSPKERIEAEAAWREERPYKGTRPSIANPLEDMDNFWDFTRGTDGTMIRIPDT